jgi:hypothetical protein
MKRFVGMFAGAVAAVTLVAGPGPASGHIKTVQFDDLGDGQVVNQTIAGVSVTSHRDDQNPLRVFDSRKRQTALSHLEGADGYGGTWGLGNLPARSVLGHLITKQVPHQPATIVIEFAQPIAGFGFDLIGVLHPDDGSQVRVFKQDHLAAAIQLDEFTDSNCDFYDPSIQFGPNSANRIQLITVEKLGVDSFDRVEIVLVGPYAIDNLMVEPQPDHTFGAIHKAAAPDRRPDEAWGWDTSLQDILTIPPIAAEDIVVVLNSIGPHGAEEGGAAQTTTGPADPEPDRPLAPEGPSAAAPDGTAPDDVVIIPTPTAAAAGLVLMIGLSLRRRRLTR